LIPDDLPIVLLHVGFPKTATTSLQDHVFAGLPGVCNLGKPDMPRSVKKALRHIASDDPDRFDRKYADYLREAVRDARRKARSIVISHEGMTGSRWRTVGKARVLREIGFRELRAATAERLRDSLGDARVRVLFTIREQRAWLLSTFADLVLREGLSTELADWLGRGLDRPDDFYADPDFDRTIALYESLFGKERVHVLAYEEMTADPDRFSCQLAALGDLPLEEVQRRVRGLPRTKTRAQLSDRDNPYVAKRDNPAKRHLASNVKAPTALDEMSEKAVVARCAAGNEAMGRRFGIALARFGYAVGSAEIGARSAVYEAGAPRLG
jgi:hypothetical protein